MSFFDKYKVTINNNDIKKIKHKKIENININNDEVIFDTDGSNLKLLIAEIENIKYKNTTKKRFINFIRKYLISLISIILIFILLINQNKCIRRINFVNYDSYDNNVEMYIYENLKKVGPYYYLSSSLNELNSKLKNKFYYYEWVSLTKNGAYLNVNIKRQDKLEEIKENNNLLGNIFSSKDAIIIKYYMTSGIAVIQEGQFVKKGDLLISGNLLHKKEGELYISPKAIVIGEVYEFYDITINKEESEERKTGKLNITKKILLFNKKYEKETKYENGIVVCIEKFNFFNIFKINTYYDYEITKSKTVYNYDDALAYAKSKIIKQIKLDTYEEIKYLELLKYYEDKNNFYFRIIVKLNKSIGQFVEINKQ